jgi:hypothetical protein
MERPRILLWYLNEMKLIYIFHRTGLDKGAYYNEIFLRGKPFLTHRIERIKVKGAGPRKPNSPETEPNFYLMEPLPPSTAEAKFTRTPSPMASILALERAISDHEATKDNSTERSPTCQLLLPSPFGAEAYQPSRGAFSQLLQPSALLLAGTEIEYMNHQRFLRGRAIPEFPHELVYGQRPHSLSARSRQFSLAAALLQDIHGLPDGVHKSFWWNLIDRERGSASAITRQPGFAV